MEAKVTIPALLQMKRDGQKSVGVVAWDYQIARSYLDILRQDRSAWTWEIELRPWVEKF